MVRLKRFGLLFLVFLAVMLCGLRCIPDGGEGTPIGYIENVDTNQWQIISIDATTGSTSIIATLESGDPDGVPDCGFAVDSANDKAYLCGSTLEGGGYVHQIYTIDLITGTSSNVPLSGRPGVVGVCFDVYNE